MAIDGDAVESCSVERWIELVRVGDERAATEIWERFFPRMVALAADRLRQGRGGGVEGEDAALSALDSFFRAGRQGRWDGLTGRDELWRLLSRMTRRKAIDAIRRQARAKRGGGRVRGESVFGGAGETAGFDGLAQSRLTPDLVVMFDEQQRILMDSLVDPALKSIAAARLAGNSVDEIARDRHCSVSTVERRLRLIRRIWEERF